MSAKPFVYQWCDDVAESDLPTTAKALAWRMASYGNVGGREIRPTVQTLAGDLSVSEPTVKRAKKVLVDGGWIVEVKSPRHGHRGARATEYRLAARAERNSRTPVTPQPADQQIIHDLINRSSTTDQQITRDPLPAHDQPIDHSARRLAGSSPAMPAPDFDAMMADRTDPDLLIEWLDSLGYSDRITESTAAGMLMAGEHPKAILHTIKKRAEDVDLSGYDFGGPAAASGGRAVG